MAVGHFIAREAGIRGRFRVEAGQNILTKQTPKRLGGVNGDEEPNPLRAARENGKRNVAASRVGDPKEITSRGSIETKIVLSDEKHEHFR